MEITPKSCSRGAQKRSCADRSLRLTDMSSTRLLKTINLQNYMISTLERTASVQVPDVQTLCPAILCQIWPLDLARFFSYQVSRGINKAYKILHPRQSHTRQVGICMVLENVLKSEA